MQRSALIASLSATDLFAGLPETLLDKLAERMRERAFDTGQLVFSRGDDGARLYLVVEGRVRLSVVTDEGRELAFRQAKAGDILGEIAVLDGGMRTADATAIGPVRTMALERKDALDLLRAEPAFAEAIVQFLCRRVRDTSQQLENIALFPIEVRLARLLLALAGQAAVTGKTALVEPKMSQSEIALLIGASRPKVNAAIGELEARGALTRQGDGFQCRLARLTEIAGTDEA
jgi:CRP/FNR family transcriptional regulator, cyclic AMP receptor protein